MSRIPQVSLRIVPSGLVRESELLETSPDQLASYLATAPQWRIERWSLAASADGRTLVRGLPLPPLPGTQWTNCDGICVPAGCAWSPAVEPAVLRQLLQLRPNDLALLRENGTWDCVAADDWVRAGRSVLHGSDLGRPQEAR
jgi:hypothetical protein